MKYAPLFLIFALAAPAPARSPARSPVMPASPPSLFGRWALDLSKMPVPAQYRPRSVIFLFADSGGGKGRMTVDIVDADGSQRHMASSFAFDATPTTIEGDQGEADSAAVTMPRPDVLVLNLAKAGAPASTRIYTVAPDGRSMTETNATWGDDGKPVMRINALRRVK